MGHIPIDGAGRLACRARRPVRPAHLHPHQQHQSDPDRRTRRSGGMWRPRAGRSPTTEWSSSCDAAARPTSWKRALREIGARRYHRLHPFHTLLHGGKCSKGQVQAWALNRYYYQAMIPIKDASLIARCDDPALRREWRSRLVDHDGEREGRGRHRALAAPHRWPRSRSRLCRRRARAPCRRRASRSTPMSTSCARSRCSKRSPRR